MAQPATNPKIEELRFRLKTDPKSRLFYQLAEELRRGGQFDESEKILRHGLDAHPTYLAAWVSLGRVLREQKNDGAAVDALNRALQLDPGNVVAARLLADAYLALGEKVEAIKKYKLVLALLPSDEELRVKIEQIDREIHPPQVAAAEAAAPEMESAGAPFSFSGGEDASAGEAAPAGEEASAPFEDSPFDKTTPPFEEASQSLGEEMRLDEETADAEPMAVAHEESPFEEPVSSFSSASMEIEGLSGMQVVSAPMSAELPLPVYEEDPLPVADATPVFDTPPAAAAPSADATDTLTMADLYARQGLVEEARNIYENILARNPDNAEVRGKLDAIAPRANPKVAALERWLAKVTRREVGRV